MSDAFAGLDTSVPLALLPVRLEARLIDDVLRVRILADTIHANAHEQHLTLLEQRAGFVYWQALHDAPGDDAARSVLRNNLAAVVGAHRAIWVANETQPKNWGSTDEKLVFPTLKTVEAAGPVRAEQLPDHFVYRIYDRQLTEIAQGRCPSDVATNLAMAPTLGAVDPAEQIEPDDTRDDHIDAYLKSQNLRWMIDFDAALDVGMAFEWPLGKNDPRLGAILVAGVRTSDKPWAAAEALDAQLKAHWYTRGVDVLPQGTATNNTEDATTGHATDTDPDIDALFAQDAQRRPVAALARAKLLDASPAALYKVPAADTLSLAFGMTFDNLLDRAAHAELPEGLGGSVMNAAICTGLGQFFLAEVFVGLGDPPFGSKWRETARHHIDWVRAAGPVPSLRIGDQPYGVLPIQGRLDPKGADPKDADLIELILGLFPSWRAARPLATLDPDATDGARVSDPSQTVETLLEVLGAIPHPGNFHLRTLDVVSVKNDVEIIDDAINEIKAVFEDPASTYGAGWEDILEQFRAQILGVPTFAMPDVVAPSMAAQVTYATAFLAFLESGYIDPTHEPIIVGIYNDKIAPLIERYQDATDAMPALIGDMFGRGGISQPEPAVNKPERTLTLAHSLYTDTLSPIGVEITLDGTLDALDTLIEDIADRLKSPNNPNDRPPLVDFEAPLLHQLLDLGHLFVANNDAPEFVAALRVLQVRIAGVLGRTADDPELIATVDELMRLQREAISTFMNRLDAWVTSFSARRLAETRAKTPRGIQAGGYGWLLDFAPSQGPVSEGFIHAHSLNHATTAAVLRSGWAGYGTANETAPLSVDLTSDRVRGAEWVLDGVRNGQDLSETLGARFERYLHDDAMALDAYIDELRALSNAPKSLPLPRAHLCDGVQVARAFSAGRTLDEDVMRQDILNYLSPVDATLDGRKNRRVREICAQLADDLDAVSDLTMAESVHAMAQGKDAQTASVLNMLGDEEGAVPPITVPDAPREGQIIAHRITTILPPTTDQTGTALGIAEPGLTQWLEQHLPLPSEVICTVAAPNNAGAIRKIGEISLDALGLSPVVFLPLAGRRETQDSTLLARLLLARAQAEFGDKVAADQICLKLGSAPRDKIDVNTFGLVLGAARDAIGASRALQPADLTANGAEISIVTDDSALAARASAMTQHLRDMGDELLQKTALNAPVLPIAAELVGLQITGAVGLFENPQDRELRRAVVDAIEQRITDAQTQVDAGAQLRKLIAGALPILPSLIVPAGDPVQGSAATPGLQVQVAEEGALWWGQIAKVSASAAALADFTDLAAAVLGLAPTQTKGAVQLPFDPDEDWAAISRPKPDGRDRLCLYVSDGIDALQAGLPVSGLVSGSWSETIPREDQQTAIAYHFDAPSARAPQVILLSMLEDGDADGDLDDQVFDQLINTIDLMKTRAVGADRSGGMGHYAPATFVPDDFKVTPEPGEAGR